MTGSMMIHEILSIDGIAKRDYGTYATLTMVFTDKDNKSSDITLFSHGTDFVDVNTKVDTKVKKA